jgi:hypothetical protein
MAKKQQQQQKTIFCFEKSELSEMAKTLIEKFAPYNYVDDDIDDDIDEIDDVDVDNVVGGLGRGDLGFLRAQTREARTPLGMRQYLFLSLCRLRTHIFGLVRTRARSDWDK